MSWQALTSNLAVYDGFLLLLSRLICFWSSALWAGWLFGQFKSQKRNHRAFVGIPRLVKSLLCGAPLNMQTGLKQGGLGRELQVKEKSFFLKWEDKQRPGWHFGFVCPPFLFQINLKHCKRKFLKLSLQMYMSNVSFKVWPVSTLLLSGVLFFRRFSVLVLSVSC